MMYIDLPNINPNGTAEQQLAEIRSYIYRNNEQINAALSNLGPEKVFEAATTALSSAADSENELPEHLNRYRKLRDLIIKTADSIVKTEETWSMALNGSYLAKSQFGEYLLNTSVTVEGDPTGFRQLYDYSTTLGSDYGIYKHNMQNYIKHGLLDDSGATPVYGIEVGLLEDEFTIIDEETGAETTITPTYRYRTRITPDKWSFLRDSSSSSAEVAYITEDKICFPKAEITGGSINIGVRDNNGIGKFYVDSRGVMTAKEGTFYGTIAASSLTNSWNTAFGDSMYLSSSALKFRESGKDRFSISSGGMTFYRTSLNYDTPMAYFRRLGLENTDHMGMGIQMHAGTGSFFIIGSETEDAMVYIPSAPATQYNNDNLYSVPGVHFPMEVQFHSAVDFNNKVIANLNITSLTSNGSTGITGQYTIKLQGGAGDLWATLEVKNGIITAITPVNGELWE